MKFSLHYSILLVAATVACVAAAPTPATPEPADVTDPEFVSVINRLEGISKKFDQEKTQIAQEKTQIAQDKTEAEKKMKNAQALADDLEGKAALARELATGASKIAEQTRRTLVTSLGDAVDVYTRAKDSYEKTPGKPELDKEVLQNLNNVHGNTVSAIDANSIGRDVALNAALEADTKQKEADDAKTTVASYALSIEELTKVDNVISQKKQALVDRMSACVNDMECSIMSIIGDFIEESVDEIETAEDETDEDETDEDKVEDDKVNEDTVEDDKVNEDKVEDDKVNEDKVEDDKVNEDKVEDDKVDEDKTVTAGEKSETADDKAKTTDDKTVTTEDKANELEVKKKADEETDKVDEEKEDEMKVEAMKTPDQETPEDKDAEKKKLEEIAAEKEKKEKRVKDTARDAAKKKAEEVAEDEKAGEKGNKNKEDKAEVVTEEGEATKKGEMKEEDKPVQEEKAGENDESKGEDKIKNAVVQDSGAKFNQPAVAVGILSVMFALAFGV